MLSSFVKMQARQGASLSDVIERITPEAIACHLYAADLPDPRLDHPNEWRNPLVRLPTVAERAQRVLLHGCAVAGFSQG